MQRLVLSLVPVSAFVALGCATQADVGAAFQVGNSGAPSHYGSGGGGNASSSGGAAGASDVAGAAGQSSNSWGVGGASSTGGAPSSGGAPSGGGAPSSGGTSAGGGGTPNTPLVPQSCSQTNSDVGCCGTNTDLYYCTQSSTSPKHEACSGGQVCGWDATNSWYGCIAGPSSGDPSGTYPMTCGN